MPGPKKILPQHTLENGFRIFYNETVDSVPVTASLMPDGKFRITRFDNSFFEVPLTALFYTKEQINTLLVNLGIEPATSLKAGIAKLSTESDVLAGTNESDIVTPYLLNYLLDLLVGNLPDLLTDDKTSIVAAINELKENGGGISADDLGQGLIISSDKLTLDLESKTLVSPSISVTWTIFKNDGTTPYSPATSNSGGITVDKGCVVNLSSYYSYPAPNSTQAAPTGVSGNYPLPLPAPGVNSNTLSVNGITTNQSFNVTLTKPKSGLIVVSNQVQFASGNDATGGGISVSFKVRGTLVYSDNSVLTASEIEAAINATNFRDSRSIAFTGVGPSSTQYVYILLDSELGDITSIIQNGTDQVFTAFTYLSPVSITNAAGATRTVKPLRSNIVNAFLPGTSLTTA